jgi:hypothetical protein
MFEVGVLQSGFWHQFAMTAHSPVGLYPERFGVLKETETLGTFANNDINYTDKTGIDHDQFSFGLNKSLFNFMHGICFDYALQDWFEFKIPKTKIDAEFIYNAVSESEDVRVKGTAKVVWLGGKGVGVPFVKTKKGNSWEMMALTFHDKKETFVIEVGRQEGEWLLWILEKLSVRNVKVLTFGEVKAYFEEELEDFELFWQSKGVAVLRGFGLLVL